mgnify:CR=1 FL=1
MHISAHKPFQPGIAGIRAGNMPFCCGRNMGHGNVPKSASVAEYRRATGMEVLFGYLSLTGQTRRIDHLFRVGYGLIPADVHQQVGEHSYE